MLIFCLCVLLEEHLLLPVLAVLLHHAQEDALAPLFPDLPLHLLGLLLLLLLPPNNGFRLQITVLK